MNKILVLATTLVAAVPFAPAQTWTQTGAPSNSWQSVACSADGTEIVAIAGDGIYFSTNSGTAWTSNSTVMSALALSADGNKWAAVNGGTYVYVSTNWGATWAAINAPTQEFYFDFTLKAVASSADGNKLLVGPPVFTSSDSGRTWTAQNVGGDSIASSADGIKLFAVFIGQGGGFFASTNSGDVWISNSVPSSLSESIASSADGNKLALLVDGDGIYTSTDLGATWTRATNVPAGIHDSIVSSADGTKLAASTGQTLYVSVDSGATWATNNAPDGGNKGKAVALSADGNELIAAVHGGGIWTLQTTPTPSINLTPTNGNLALSWLIPSTNFVLQTSLDLSSWTDVPDPPVLNLTNLQYVVTLPATNGGGFFRLKTL